MKGSKISTTKMRRLGFIFIGFSLFFIIIVPLLGFIGSIPIYSLETTLYTNDFQINGNERHYSIREFGPGQIEIVIDNHATAMNIRILDSQGLELINNSDTDFDFTYFVEEQGDYTISLTGASSDIDITVTFRPEYRGISTQVICCTSCTFVTGSLIIGPIILTYGILLIIKSKRIEHHDAEDN